MSPFLNSTEEISYGILVLNADGTDHSYGGRIGDLDYAKSEVKRYAAAERQFQAGRTVHLVEQRIVKTRKVIS